MFLFNVLLELKEIDMEFVLIYAKKLIKYGILVKIDVSVRIIMLAMLLIDVLLYVHKEKLATQETNVLISVPNLIKDGKVQLECAYVLMDILKITQVNVLEDV